MKLVTLAMALVLVQPVAARATEPITGWPLQGAILRPFDAGTSPYSSGHRGIDIAAPLGTRIGSAGPGVVAFAGFVAGSLYVSVDHPGGIRTTYSWLAAVMVKKGDALDSGDTVGLSGVGHPGSEVPHLHLGVRVGGTYVDPLMFLPPFDLSALLRLAPMH